METINKTKSQFLEKINKINRNSAKIMKKKSGSKPIMSEIGKVKQTPKIYK